MGADHVQATCGRMSTSGQEQSLSEVSAFQRRPRLQATPVHDRSHDLPCFAPTVHVLFLLTYRSFCEYSGMRQDRLSVLTETFTTGYDFRYDFQEFGRFLGCE